MKIKNILYLCIITLGLFAFTVNQNSSLQVIPEISNYTDTSKQKDFPKGKTFEVVDKMPEFSGGLNAMMQFVAKNFKYPLEARKHHIEGRILITFVVNEVGKVTDIKPLLAPSKQLGYGLEQEGTSIPQVVNKTNLIF